MRPKTSGRTVNVGLLLRENAVLDGKQLVDVLDAFALWRRQ